MLLKSERKHEGLREVLFDWAALGPKVAYWVFGEIGDADWENLTVVAPGKYGHEFTKTYGHYHTSTDETEIYKVAEGRGVFLLQKKFYTGDTWEKYKVNELILIKAEPGDTIRIPQDYGHAWVNIGSTPLVTLDNWKWGHTPDDYAVQKELKGMAYYIMEQKNELKLMPNPKYTFVPTPVWMSAKDFNAHHGK